MPKKKDQQILQIGKSHSDVKWFSKKFIALGLSTDNIRLEGGRKAYLSFTCNNTYIRDL